jgi:hypothetical protein
MVHDEIQKGLSRIYVVSIEILCFLCICRPVRNREGTSEPNGTVNHTDGSHTLLEDGEYVGHSCVLLLVMSRILLLFWKTLVFFYVLWLSLVVIDVFVIVFTTTKAGVGSQYFWSNII